MGTAFSAKNQGADDDRDNDIHPTGMLLGFTDTVSFMAGVSSTDSIDAGPVGPRLFADGFE